MTTKDTSATQEEAKIRSLLDDRLDALRAKDAQRFMSHFAEGFVTYELAPPLQYTAGDPHDTKSLEEWFSSFHGSVECEMRDLHIFTDNEVAFCHSLYRIAGAKSDEQIDMWTRQTICFRKEYGKWQIAHSHTSVPFHMDGSRKAAVELKP